MRIRVIYMMIGVAIIAITKFLVYFLDVLLPQHVMRVVNNQLQ